MEYISCEPFSGERLSVIIILFITSIKKLAASSRVIIQYYNDNNV